MEWNKIPVCQIWNDWPEYNEYQWPLSTDNYNPLRSQCDKDPHLRSNLSDSCKDAINQKFQCTTTNDPVGYNSSGNFCVK